MYYSRIGHVGPNVIVEVPLSKDSLDITIDITSDGHSDMDEIEKWEFVKMHSDYKDYKYDNIYHLESR